MIEISWDKYIQSIKELAGRVKNANFEADKIIAINRGGLLIGLIFSHQLNKPLYIIDIRENKVKWLDLNRDDKVIVVDDISDRGDTLRLAENTMKEMFGLSNDNILTVTLYIRPDTGFIPDIYFEEVHDWVVFPYEIDIYRRGNS